MTQNTHPTDFLLEILRDKEFEDISVTKNAAVDCSLAAILFVDKSRCVTYANASARTLFNVALNCSMVGTPVVELFMERSNAEEMFKNLELTGNWSAECLISGHADDPHTVIISANLVIDEGGKAINAMISCVDITALKKAQDREKALQHELIQSANMATVGAVASGLAHELAQPLQAFKGAVFLIEERLKKLAINDENIMKQMQHLGLFINKLETLTKGIKNFVRKEKTSLIPISVNEAIENCILVMTHKLRKSQIELALQLAPDLPNVMGVLHKLEQVSVNMISNAIDAMGQNGRIEIRTSYREGRVYTEWQNNGPPIPQELIGKIFDILFTTKPRGEGTGLGLNICQEIVLEHKGTLEVFSDATRTVFTMSIPVMPR